MGNSWETASYVLSSRYRQEVVSCLAVDGPATTSQIAEATGIAQPHVSRALSELQAKEVVELLVPEERKRGRIYHLTSTGQTIHQLIEQGVEQPAWEIRDPESDAERAVLDRLQAAARDTLRVVARHDQGTVEIFYIREDVQASYTDEDFERALGDLLEDAVRQQADEHVPIAGELNYQVRAYEALTLLRMYPGEEVLSVSFDPEFSETTRELVEECLETFPE